MLISLVFFVAGIIIASIPVIIYCLVTNSFFDLIEVYFYNNIFSYVRKDHTNPVISLLVSLFMGSLSMMKNNTLCLPLVLCIIIYFLKHSRRLAALYIFEFAFSFLLVYSGGRRFAYYSLILCVFIPVGICVVILAVNNKIKNRAFLQKFPKELLSGVIVFACVVSMFLFSPNIYMLKYRKEDLAQIKFADIINESENPTLLNYGFMDGGFYTASGVVPNCRYFCSLNVKGELIRQSQDEYIRQGRIKYIVALDKNLSFENYTLISEAVTENRVDDFVYYYLYKHNDE